MSANLGSLEMMGHIANGAKYRDAHRSLVLDWRYSRHDFFGLFMVRYYYANGIRSVPEYLPCVMTIAPIF